MSIKTSLNYIVINLLVSIDVLTLPPPELRQLALRTVPLSSTFVQDAPKEPLYIYTWAIVFFQAIDIEKYFLLLLCNKRSVWVAKTCVDINFGIEISLPCVVFAIRSNLPIVGIAVGGIYLYICATPGVPRVGGYSYCELTQSNKCQCNEILCLHDGRLRKVFHSCTIQRKCRGRGDCFFFNIRKYQTNQEVSTPRALQLAVCYFYANLFSLVI